MVPALDARAGVTARALAVLAAFSAVRPELTLSEVSRHTGLPLTTTHRLVTELTRWGALERGDRGYHIGLRLWEIGSLAPRPVGLREAAMPFLEDVYEATRENVQLAVLDETDVVYVERLSGRQAVHVVTRAGSRLPAHATAVGLVLLAYSTPDVLDRVLERPLKRFTARTLTHPDRLREALVQVRRTGYAISEQAVEMVSNSVAAPVFGPRGALLAGLSVVVPARDADTRNVVPTVRAAARGISRAMGGLDNARR